MPVTLPDQPHARPRKQLAGICLKPAKAGLVARAADPMYDCIEAVQRAFDKSEKEMSDLLAIAQSNYSRRSYNAARVQRLPVEMRTLFVEYFAQTEGLRVNVATPHEQVKAAAKIAIVNLLNVMESA